MVGGVDGRLISLGRSEPPTQHEESEVPTRKNPGMVDTSERTGALDAMKARREEELSTIRSNRDLTPEARRRAEKELQQKYAEEMNQEASRVMAQLDREIEAAYAEAYGPERPSSDHQAEVAKELRLARLRDEVSAELESGADPLRAFKDAIRLGDKERAQVIGKVGQKYLKGDFVRAQRLQDLAETQQPEHRRHAKERLTRLETEKR